MTTTSAAVVLAAVVSSTAFAAQAAICDHKPSRWIGGGGSGVVASAGAGTAAAGIAANALGYYTLVHATTGLTMLGSTAAGASAAGTVGIIAGSAGLGASIVAFVTAPATIIVGGITAVAIGAYEGGCYFAVERVTDEQKVTEILQDMAARADPEFFELVEPYGNGELYLNVRGVNPSDGINSYAVRDLYIADEMLKHRDLGPNTTIGRVIFVDPNEHAEEPPE